METIINRGYKFKIAPTKDQKEFFLQSFGCARKIYNMYVDELYRKLEESSYQNGIIKKYNSTKNSIKEIFPILIPNQNYKNSKNIHMNYHLIHFYLNLNFLNSYIFHLYCNSKICIYRHLILYNFWHLLCCILNL